MKGCSTHKDYRGGGDHRPGGALSVLLDVYVTIETVFRLFGLMTLVAITMSATMAPRVAIYTLLVCSVHKPDIFDQDLNAFASGSSLTIYSSTINNSTLSMLAPSLGLEKVLGFQTCASDPTVQAAVARLIASE